MTISPLPLSLPSRTADPLLPVTCPDLGIHYYDKNGSHPRSANQRQRLLIDGYPRNSAVTGVEFPASKVISLE